MNDDMSATMRTYVLHLHRMADGSSTPFDDSYVIEYDPEHDSVGPDGYVLRCVLKTTSDRFLATRFPSLDDALRYARRVPERQPMGPLGIVNRPLTAFSFSVEPI